MVAVVTKRSPSSYRRVYRVNALEYPLFIVSGGNPLNNGSEKSRQTLYGNASVEADHWYVDGVSPSRVEWSIPNAPSGAVDLTIFIDVVPLEFTTGVETVLFSQNKDTVTGSTTHPVLVMAEDGTLSVGFFGHRIIPPKNEFVVGDRIRFAVTIPGYSGSSRIWINGSTRSWTTEGGSPVTLNEPSSWTAMIGAPPDLVSNNYGKSRVYTAAMWNAILPDAFLEDLTADPSIMFAPRRTVFLLGVAGGLSLVKLANETVQASEQTAQSMALARAAGEAVQTNEQSAVALAVARILGETVQSQEAFAAALSVVRSASETVQAQESSSLARALARLLGETVQETESTSLARGLSFAASETLQLSETAVPVISALIVQIVAEALQAQETTSQAAVLSRVVSETEQAQELVAISRAVARHAIETLQASELQVLAKAISRALSETEQASEVTALAKGIVYALTESQQISEALAKTIAAVAAEALLAAVKLYASASGSANIKASLNADSVTVSDG